MDTAGNLSGNGRGAGNAAGNASGNGNTAGNFVGNGTGSNATNGYANTGNGFTPRYAPATGFPPAGYNPALATTAAPTQNYEQLKAMWEAQRKQAEEMLKRIEAAQKAAATKS